MSVEEYPLPAQAVTSGAYHFFGYYDKFPWDRTGHYLLALQTTFMDRQPTEKDAAVIGVIDTHQGNQWRAVDQTYAWNWQQSTMLQWLPSPSGKEIIYNQLQNNQFISIIRNIDTGETRSLPRPIYTLSHDGSWAISLNFARLHQTRPGYGYAGVPDKFDQELAPADDGIYQMDLQAGTYNLIISLEQLSQTKPQPSMQGAKHWVNHAQINPDNSRFAVLHRWRPPGESHWRTRLITARPDGSEIYIVADHDYVSHYDWYSPSQVVAWSRQREIGARYFMYTDCSTDIRVIGEGVFSEDGHCSFSPDRQWMVTDTYPDSDHNRTLMLYHMETGRRVDIGKFYAPPELEGPIRCDLHPRWSRDGKQLCIDSAHEGSRQIYVIDVHSVIES